jgi:Flp pilus assembly protein TadG
MSKETSAMNPLRTDRKAERGQILVLFTIAVVVIIGMLGLVLDGGSAFAQRRDQQNVADLAAMAGADAYLTSTGDNSGDAIAAARWLAQKNGYATDAVPGEVVDVLVTPNTAGASVKVTVTQPHNNNFSTIMGMPTWGVSATATAQASLRPNGAIGAMPLLFNEAAFPHAICDERTTTDGCASELETYQLPGTGTEDVPQDATQFNWTVFCTHEAAGPDASCEGDSDGVSDLINQGGETTTVFLDEAIGPLNAGTHTTLFDDLEAYVGGTFPVPIVCTTNNNDPDHPENDCPYDGAMVGWAYFKIISIEGAPDKVIKGYFVAPVVGDEMVVDNSHETGSLNTGTYLLKLTN